MTVERLEAQGIKTAHQLFKGLYDSGISPKIASHLHNHEKAHADADEERSGEFGFIATSGWIVAYYLVKGERTPEQRMKIASAPGFSEMSDQDWRIYNAAWGEYLKNLAEEDFKRKFDKTPGDKYELTDFLVEIMTKKFDGLIKTGEFPELEEVLGYEFKDLIEKFGVMIYQIYRDSVEEVRRQFEANHE